MTKQAKKVLADDAARRTAILAHDRSLLVEAGAGSGKTAVLAGRIAMMLAAGIAPKSIAAVTFTELAASELLLRVREFVAELLAGRTPPELEVALPNGLSPWQNGHLQAAGAAMDEIVCSTIHGFCKHLITPYPVEADIDPGAVVMDKDAADLAFAEIVDQWLWNHLSGSEGSLIAEMVLYDSDRTVALIRQVVGHLRRQRTATAPRASSVRRLVGTFRTSVALFAGFLKGLGAIEAETATIAASFGVMANAVAFAEADDDPASLIKLLVTSPDPALCTAAGNFRAYQKKGKWLAACRQAGLEKGAGEQLNDEAGSHYATSCATWEAMLQGVASRVLADLVAELAPVLNAFRDHKRAAALLDFDDLIFAARDLLRDHEQVRRALAGRYTHVLVDEFQDTDPLQTEIFWRLCGEPPDGGAPTQWESFEIRQGALFLVGDPKQAIYRFRGADVNAYVRAREALVTQDAQSILSISTNFRSLAPVLDFVNAQFKAPLSSDGQPGFTPLNPFHGDRGHALCVAALDVAVADADGKASAEQQRDGEAEVVAELCARLIGSEAIIDHKTGRTRPCRPGDIALLAPTGSDLWRYEEALERFGVPVATQAGKGLYRRQEIQDLIAITRVLADRRDALALGALLRGPLVGLTEEELLDIVWALPRPADKPDAMPKLDLRTDPGAVHHPLARDILQKLQSLRRSATSTTPYNVLSAAVDTLNVRPMLVQRHRGQAERALANVDLYLSMSQAFSVRGLLAFAETMTAAWTDESRAAEGRPDAQEEAVALYTMHAAKGLEWPIVIPVNTMTAIKATDAAVTDRDNGRFYCPVFGVPPVGYRAARDKETAELDHERIRLWYVAATRARELLVLPRLNVATPKSAYSALLDLSLAQLPAIDCSQLPLDMGASRTSAANTQSAQTFAQEAATIASQRRRLKWIAPSRDEGAISPTIQALEPTLLAIDRDDEVGVSGGESVNVQGGRERGLIIHKLLEEVLTGETEETRNALTERARTLIEALGCQVVDDSAKGLAAAEIAGSVAQTLALPEIANLRPRLVPEFPVYASTNTGDIERLTAGIADAIALTPDGRPDVVIDWKSDIRPSDTIMNHYRTQVRNYLLTTGATLGLVVFTTSGTIVAVEGT